MLVSLEVDFLRSMRFSMLMPCVNNVIAANTSSRMVSMQMKRTQLRSATACEAFPSAI